jgi:hypothetical protein
MRMRNDFQIIFLINRFTTVNYALKARMQQLQLLTHSMQPLLRGYEVQQEALKRMLRKEEGEKKVMRAMEIRAKQKVTDVKHLRVITENRF